MLEETLRKTSWPSVQEFDIKGDYKGRDVTAKYGENSFRFLITFGTSGQIRDFKKL
jgi:Ta0938